MNTETEAARPFAPGDLVTRAARIRGGVADPDILGTVTGLTGAGRVGVRWWRTEGYGGWEGDYSPSDLRRVKIVPVADENPQAAGDSQRPFGEGASDE